MGTTHRLFAQLESRRARLGMSKADLARALRAADGGDYDGLTELHHRLAEDSE
jgi:hypothetical protein